MAQSAVDIWLSAQALIDAHGDNAPGIATTEADNLAEDGDWHGQAVWRHIARAAEMLVAARRPAEAHRPEHSPQAPGFPVPARKADPSAKTASSLPRR